MNNEKLDAPDIGVMLEIAPPCGDGFLTTLYEQNSGDLISLSFKKEVIAQLDSAMIMALDGGPIYPYPIPPWPTPRPSGVHTATCNCLSCNGCCDRLSNTTRCGPMSGMRVVNPKSPAEGVSYEVND